MNKLIDFQAIPLRINSFNIHQCEPVGTHIRLGVHDLGGAYPQDQMVAFFKSLKQLTAIAGMGRVGIDRRFAGWIERNIEGAAPAIRGG